MVRNCLNFIKSRLNFRRFKKIGGFWGILGNLEEEGYFSFPGMKKANSPIPHTSRNRKSDSSFIDSISKKMGNLGGF